MQKLTEENMLHYPLNGEQMEKINPDAKLYLYTDLNRIFDINDLFKNTKKIMILYLLRSSSDGHWTCLWKNENRSKNKYEFSFFDSYGEEEDHHLDKLKWKRRTELNEKQNRLKMLLRNYDVEYNNVQLQMDGTDTCGMFVTHRLHHSNLNTKQYVDFFKNNGIKSPDLYVAKYTLELFKKYNVN